MKMNGIAMIAQQNVRKIAKQIGIYGNGYSVSCNPKWHADRTEKRMSGICSAVEDEDIVIFQSPTWQAD